VIAAGEKTSTLPGAMTLELLGAQLDYVTGKLALLELMMM